MNKQERQWQKESDARVLLEAEKIKNDPKRHSGAKQEIHKTIKDNNEDIKIAKSIVSKNDIKQKVKTGKFSKGKK